MIEIKFNKKVTLKEHTIFSIVFSHNNRYFLNVLSPYSPQSDFINVRELETGKLVCSFKYENRVKSIAVSSNIFYILSGSEVWELDSSSAWTHNLIWSQGCSQNLWGNLIEISPDGRYVITQSEGNTIKVLEIRSGKQLFKIGGHRYPIKKINVSLDNRYIMTTSEDKTMKIWEFNTGRLVHTLKKNHDFGSSLFSSDGGYLITVADYNNLNVWELESGNLKHNIKGHKSYIDTLNTFGNYVISGSRDKTIKIWELTTGKLLHTLKEHTAGVSSIAISPDGRYLFSGSIDKTVKVWELLTGKLLKTLEGHDDWITSVMVSPNGRYIITTSSAGPNRSQEYIIWLVEY